MWYILLRKDILLNIVKFELLYDIKSIYIVNKNTLNDANEFSLFGAAASRPKKCGEWGGGWLKFVQNFIPSVKRTFS